MKLFHSLVMVLTALVALSTAAPSLACQFDPPGMTHEAWKKWVEERNQKNEAANSPQPESKVAKKTKVTSTTAATRVNRFERRGASDNAVIRIGR